jgi:putative Mg2+ transporter-C (MgtC) family protein
MDWAALLGGGDWLSVGQIGLRLGAAIGLSCLIGLDRELKHKSVGLRTHMLIALGAASMCLITIELLHMTNPGPNARPIDAGRVHQGIITAIGFLGAGAIIQGPERVFGATTGAGVWVVGAIGIACGFGLFAQAVAVTLIALFVLTVLGFLERRRHLRERSE